MQVRTGLGFIKHYAEYEFNMAVALQSRFSADERDTENILDRNLASALEISKKAQLYAL